MTFGAHILVPHSELDQQHGCATPQIRRNGGADSILHCLRTRLVRLNFKAPVMHAKSYVACDGRISDRSASTHFPTATLPPGHDPIPVLDCDIDKVLAMRLCSV
jgi:hypothetical protein